MKNELNSMDSELHEKKLELEREIVKENKLSKELAEAQKMVSLEFISIVCCYANFVQSNDFPI